MVFRTCAQHFYLQFYSFQCTGVFGPHIVCAQNVNVVFTGFFVDSEFVFLFQCVSNGGFLARTSAPLVVLL